MMSDMSGEESKSKADVAIIPESSGGTTQSLQKSPIELEETKEELEKRKICAEIQKVKEECKTAKWVRWNPLFVALIQMGGLIGAAYFTLAPKVEQLKQEQGRYQLMIDELKVGQNELAKTLDDARMAAQNLEALRHSVLELSGEQETVKRRSRLTSVFQRFTLYGPVNQELVKDAQGFRDELVPQSQFESDVEELKLWTQDKEKLTAFWAFFYAACKQPAAFKLFDKLASPRDLHVNPILAWSIGQFPAKEFHQTFSKFEDAVIQDPRSLGNYAIIQAFKERIAPIMPKLILWAMLLPYQEGCSSSSSAQVLSAPSENSFQNSQVMIANAMNIALAQQQKMPILLVGFPASTIKWTFLKRADREQVIKDQRFLSWKDWLRASTLADYWIFNNLESEVDREDDRRLIEKLKCPKFREVSKWPEQLIRKMVQNEWISLRDLEVTK